jgi:hypothetical protein
MGKTKAKMILYASFTMTDFESFCEDEGMDVNEQTMNEYRDWKHSQEEMYWENMLSWFKEHSLEEHPCIIQGMVGRWNGTFEIVPRYAPRIEDAINLCSRNTHLKSVTRIGDEIEIKCGHHDGTDVFKIVFLSEIGQRKYWTNNKVVGLKNRENILRLP